MNKLKKVICVLLSACMISMPVAFSITASGADNINSLLQQLKDLDEKNKEYQDIIDKTQSDIKEKEKYSEALTSKIKTLDEKILLTHQSIDSLNSSIAEKQAEIDKDNEGIADQMNTLRSRIRTIYMAGNASDLEIILGAKDFSDLIDKAELVKTLSNYDKTLIDNIKVQLDAITEQKNDLEADKKEVESQQKSLENDQNDLNKLLEENKETLKTLYTSSDSAKTALEEATGESTELETQIKEYYAKQAALSGNASIDITASGYTWPVPGFYYLSSLWNEDRTTYNHGAIDIAGSGIMGATVVAADNGTVISVYNSCAHNWGKSGSCGCNGGYGNFVWIDHGNGKSTIYAHLTTEVVSVGQTVKKGQTLGYVGSTGNSTGAHLHFECRLNGVKYNPMLEY